jgi:hypothetical protein
MIKPILFGFAVGSVLSFICLILAGAGHGSYLFLYIYFAPLAVLSKINLTFIPAFFGGPFMYAGYGALLSRARKSRKGFQTFYVMVAVYFISLILLRNEIVNEGPIDVEKALGNIFVLSSTIIFLSTIGLMVWYVMNPKSKKQV